MRSRCGGGATAWVAGVLADQVFRGVGGYGSWKYSALEGYGKQYWPICSSILAWRTPLWQRSLAGHSLQGHKELDTTEVTLCSQVQDVFYCLWQLYPSESWAWRSCSFLACRDPGGPKHAGTWTVSVTRVIGLSESCSSLSEGLFGQSFYISPPVQALERLLCLGSYSVDLQIRCLKGHLGGGGGLLLHSSVRQEFDGPACLLFSCQCLCVGREAMVMAPLPEHDSAVLPCFYGCPAFLHRHFLPQSPPSHPLGPSLHSKQQPFPVIAPQSLNPSSQLLCLPGDLCPCPGYVWLW